MDIKMIISAAPLLTVVVAGIFSYSNVSSSTENNAEDIGTNKELIKENAEDISNLTLSQAKMEMKVETISETVSDVKADTKTILTLLQSRAPTN